MLESPNVSASLSPDEIQQLDAITRAFPIEIAELRASPKQRRFQQAFFSRQDGNGRRCDVFAALGGNRGGKSYVAGWLCFAKYVRDHAKNGDWFWTVAQTLERSIGGIQKELWNALPKWMFGDQVWGEKIGFGMHRKIVLPTGDGGKCLIEFRSADQAPSTFEQAKLTGVWCDERLPEGIYDRLLPRIVDCDGWILYSDIPEQWWQRERLVFATPEAGVFAELFTMFDNEANLPPGAIGKVSARMTEDERKQRIAGEFVIMEGLVFKSYIDRHKDKGGHLVTPFPIPEDWPKWRAIDYGNSAPTACGWYTIAPNERKYLYREHHLAGKSIQINAQHILAKSIDAEGRPERYTKSLIDPHAIDTPPVTYGAAKTVHRQYAEAGIVTTGWPYVQTMGEHAMVERCKLDLELFNFFIFETCVEFRRELQSWKFQCDAEGKPLPKDAYENKNNHLLDTWKGWLGTNPCFAVQKASVTNTRRER